MVAPSLEWMVRYRWTVLSVGALGTAVMGALRQGMPAVGPAFRDAFDLALPQVGLVRPDRLRAVVSAR